MLPTLPTTARRVEMARARRLNVLRLAIRDLHDAKRGSYEVWDPADGVLDAFDAWEGIPDQPPANPGADAAFIALTAQAAGNGHALRELRADTDPDGPVVFTTSCDNESCWCEVRLPFLSGPIARYGVGGPCPAPEPD